VLEATTAVQLADTTAMSSTGDDGRRPALDAFLARLIELLCMAADAIDTTHFTHLPPQRAMRGG
jgi:hypothetical protein